jgi:hypothetical protein
MFSNVFRYIDELTCSEELEEIIQSSKDRLFLLSLREWDEEE